VGRRSKEKSEISASDTASECTSQRVRPLSLWGIVIYKQLRVTLSDEG
jgi:hypothetical protein